MTVVKFNEAVIEQVFDLSSQDALDLVLRLSPRERQVAELMVSGAKNPEIATRLGIVERTLAIHRRHIKRKLADVSTAGIGRLWYAARLKEWA